MQAWIADSAAEMQAARLMTLHAAWRIDREGSSAARTDVSMIKFFGAKVLHDVVDRAVQIHGALGYSGDMPLEMLYRFARHARFVDGADEVHREMVARHELRDYSVPDGEVPSEHIPTRREAALRKFAGILGAEPVANAVAASVACTNMNSSQETPWPSGRRARSKRQEILAAATERFGRDGYEHTKWADIAHDVGVGPTALYHYFESKQHCLYEIMDEAIEDFRAPLRRRSRRRSVIRPVRWPP